MFHIVFQTADVDALKKSFELDEALQGDVIEIKDDFAVGPIDDIYSEEGIQRRKQWWREVLQGGDYDGHVDTGIVNDQKAVGEIKERLDADPAEFAWIWAAQNKHDVSGYYWLMSQLSEYQGRVFILYLNNLPFINTKGHIFYPSNLFDIPAREFLKAKKLARPITMSEFEIDPDEWRRLCGEGKGVRLLEGGKKLGQKDDDYYDKEIEKFITADWQKVHKLINAFLSKASQTTGDAYVLWRIKKMVGEGKYDVQGEVKNMKDFEIKAKAQAPVEVPEGV